MSAWIGVNSWDGAHNSGATANMEVNFFNVSQFVADFIEITFTAAFPCTQAANTITDNAGNSGNFQFVQAVGHGDVFCSMYYLRVAPGTLFPSFYDIQMPGLGPNGTHNEWDGTIWKGSQAAPLVTFGVSAVGGGPAPPLNKTFNPIYTDTNTFVVGMISPTATVTNPPGHTAPELTDPSLFTWDGGNPSPTFSRPGLNFGGDGYRQNSANPETWSFKQWDLTTNALFAYMTFKATDSVIPPPPPTARGGRTRVWGNFQL